MSETIETIEQIKERIAGDYNDLSSVSMTRHFSDIVAISVRYIQDLLFVHKSEVDAIAASMQIGTFEWWNLHLSLFQYGHDLSVVDFRPVYNTIDEDVQIIKYRDVSEFDGKVIMRVAKADKTVLLTTDEKNALLEYIHKIKYSGTKTILVNLPADQVTLSLDVYVDHELIHSETDDSIKIAITDYMKTSVFGGVLNVSEFQSFVKSITGANDLNLHTLSALSSSGVTTIIYSLSQGINAVNYNSESGHFNLSDVNLTLNLI